MAKTNLIDPALLGQLFDYDPDTGVLTWLPRPLSHFKNAHGCNSWNAKYAGRRAGGAGKYRTVMINGRLRQEHHVVWAMVTGKWPVEIDHENGDKHDNRFANLRLVTHLENCRNAPVRKDSSSGVTGVSRCGSRWRASIKAKDGYISLGVFGSIEEAAIARKAAEAEHGFHPNHGRRANA